MVFQTTEVRCCIKLKFDTEKRKKEDRRKQPMKSQEKLHVIKGKKPNLSGECSKFES